VRAEARLILFARAPQPGKVKTRLIAALGDVGAADLHRAMVQHCLTIACEALPGAVDLWCTPDVSHPFFAECAATRCVGLRPQGRGHLGSRMSEALLATLKIADIALIAGTDVVSLEVGDIRDAIGHLRSGKDAVVCPTEDGGYGMLGLTRHDHRLFEGVDWSTAAVMRQTQERLDALGWNWIAMPTRWDVDEPQDLERLAAFPSLASLARKRDG
jgi:rSAM/selenodomain-associated transferase 1